MTSLFFGRGGGKSTHMSCFVYQPLLAQQLWKSKTLLLYSPRLARLPLGIIKLTWNPIKYEKMPPLRSSLSVKIWFWMMGSSNKLEIISIWILHNKSHFEIDSKKTCENITFLVSKGSQIGSTEHLLLHTFGVHPCLHIKNPKHDVFCWTNLRYLGISKLSPSPSSFSSKYGFKLFLTLESIVKYGDQLGLNCLDGHLFECNWKVLEGFFEF